MAKNTQTDSAYKALSHRILILEIAPDERIGEEAWAEKLGVNRSAIREGLTRLLGEGMVYRGARGGFFVAEMSVTEIKDLREVREILETAAVKLACGRATAKQIKEIGEACDDFASFVKKGYLTGAHEADLRFHHRLVAASGNARLSHVYERSRIPLFHRKVAQMRSNLDEFVMTEKEHRAIYQAIKKRDAKAAVSALRAHFSRGMSEALS
jgi:DNA-binding GntR family transcriptional regulator